MTSSAALRLIVNLMIASTPSILSGQATGQLDPGRGPRRVGDVARRDRLARLYVDPSVSSPLRSSAWAFTLQTISEDTEVKIQANLSDVSPTRKSAISLTLISPVDGGSTSAEVVGLDGLVGKTRVELGYASNLVDPTTTKGYASITGAAPRFEYREAADLATRANQRKAIYALKAGFVYTKQQSWVASAGLRVEKGFSDRESQTLCTPLAGATGTLTCETLVVGAPIASEQRAIDATVRLSLAHVVSAGLNYAYDVKNSTHSIELPVWIVPDAGGTLSGGLKLTYMSHTERRVNLALFVGTFKL